MNKIFTSTYIKSAFVGPNQKGAPASVDLVEDIDSPEAIDNMQKCTRELNLPISCFLKKTKEKNKFLIRFFIYENEEPICGHGTLVVTQFLIDRKLIDEDTKQIEFIPLMTPEKPIISYIENGLVAIHIKTVKPTNIDINSEVGQKIIKSISASNNEKIKKYKYKSIVEGELDYTIELDKIDNMTSFDVIKSIKPDFDLIETIQLKTGKLCRGIDVLIKNDEKKNEDDEDFITRILLPLGADEKYKEDPACGSGSSYVDRYLIETYPELKGKQLKIYQASDDGAIIWVKNENDDIIKVSGKVD
jgi:PhzF family phenazine biosynthesis protein